MDNLLVVGASSGIGREVALKLAKTYRVFAMARREDRLRHLEEAGIVPVPFDVSELEAIEGRIKDLAKEQGRFKALVYCAGMQLVKPLRMLKPVDLQRMFAINFYAPVLFAKAFAVRAVHEKENPSLVFVSSIAAQRPEPGILAYSASKAALDNLVKGLAKEIAPIRVNAVSPGFLHTEMTKKFAHVYDDTFMEKVEKEYPLGLGSPEKVASLIAFLISDEADYITGDIVRVDGGGML